MKGEIIKNENDEEDEFDKFMRENNNKVDFENKSIILEKVKVLTREIEL